MRYFVLRKDIRALCYFESEDSLKLLGCIPLGMSTLISRVPPEMFGKFRVLTVGNNFVNSVIDGLRNILEIQPWGMQDEAKSVIRIRADTSIDIERWENELITEATSTREIKSDINGDWWMKVLENDEVGF